MINHFGNIYKISTFGESHGPMIGATIDGVPPRMIINLERVKNAMAHRSPGKKLTTQRQEDDEVEFISGFKKQDDGNIITTGAPLAFIIQNKDQKSKDYSKQAEIYRPGHGEYTYNLKYGIFDEKGGGRASARETACRVCAGSVAIQILEQLLGTKPQIEACILQIGQHKIDDKSEKENWPQPLFDKYDDENIFSCPDQNIKSIWAEYISKIRKQGDSVGALIALRMKNLPAGLGSPIYGKFDAEIASAMMSINAAKSVEIGAGIDVVSMLGSQYLDEMYPAQLSKTDNNYNKSPHAQFKENKHGGVIAGITTHAPIIAKVAFKPTSSIIKELNSIDLNGDKAVSSVVGRHDPCIGIRAVSVVAAMGAIVALDQYLLHRAQCGE